MIEGALAAVIVCLIIVIFWQRRKERKLLTQLSDMLEEAIRGTYREEDYDETLLSSVEAKLVRFLNSSVLSERRLSKEKDKIKTLISDISHQTKTPLANIILYTELLSEQELSDEAKNLTKALKAQSEKLNFLIGALVKMSRLENGIISVEPERNPVKSLIEEVLEQIKPKAEKKGISIDFSAPEEVYASFDRKWTVEALYNIVDNAVKYTPEGGQVCLRVTAFDMFCRISVEDTGTGIDEEEQSLIFQRFYRGKEAREKEGVGVGLYLAREIVSAEGGYIKVSSEKGKGAIFSVYLGM